MSLLITDFTYSTYLISTAIANATKRKFYSEDLPSLEDVSVK
jgi:hypothetical protein